MGDQPREFFHLNAAGAGLMTAATVEAMAAHHQLETRRGAHWAAKDAAQPLAQTRSLAAALFHVPPHQIAFGESAGRLWALAFSSMPVQPRARILVARNDWGGNIINILARAKQTGAEIQRLPMLENGVIDVERAASMIDDRVCAICVSAVASSFGRRQPVEALGAIPRPDHCLYFVDASQAIGNGPMTMPRCGADVMVAPGRKWLRGPRGQAMMALSPKALEILSHPVVLDQIAGVWDQEDNFALHGDARRFETWEFSVAGRLGLRAALLDLERAGLSAVQAAIRRHIIAMRNALRSIRDVHVYERNNEGDVAFLTFVHNAVSPDHLSARLAVDNIAIATLGLDTARWELEARGLAMVARASPHVYTSSIAIEALATSLRRLGT